MKAITFAIVLTAVASVGLLPATPAAASSLNIPTYCDDLTIIPGGLASFCKRLFARDAQLDRLAAQRAARLQRLADLRAARAAQAAARLARLQEQRLVRQQIACRNAASMGHTIPAYCGTISY